MQKVNQKSAILLCLHTVREIVVKALFTNS